MPRLQTFEGDELDAVLARVQKEAGASARVLEAKKVRDGGIGGFFAKERFVLTVEVVDEAPAALRSRKVEPDPEVAPPSSILELADLMDEAEAREATFVGARPSLAAPSRPLDPLPPIPAPAPMFRAAPFDDRTPAPAYERAPVQVPTVREPEPRPSTESETFQDVLARLAHASDVVLPAEPEVVVETLDVDSLSFERFDATSFATVEDEPAADAIEETQAVVDEVVEAIEVVDEPVMVEEETAVEEVPVPELTGDDVEERLPAVQAASPLVRVRRTPSAFERTVGMGLLELGVPAAYVPDIEGAFTNDDVRNAIIAALRLPRPPALPLGNNAIVAVVGERRAAINLAEQLADEPALNGAIVKVADRQGFTLIDGGSAAADDRGMRQRPKRTVVAIPSTPGQSGDWTRDLLDRLEPDMVWGVVPASRKSEDVASWAISLGGLDVLALTGMGKTVSPATSLRLGIPVGLIDGKCATNEAWADLLTERLVAA